MGFGEAEKLVVGAVEDCEHGGKTAGVLQFSQLVIVSTAGFGGWGVQGGRGIAD